MFIDIDSATFKYIIGKLNSQCQTANQLSEWNQLFDIETLLTKPQLAKGFRFNNHILTDGCSSICFLIEKVLLKNTTVHDSVTTDAPQKHKRVAKRNHNSEETVDSVAKQNIQQSYHPGQRIIAIDPGRVNLIYGVEELDYANFDFHQQTPERYHQLTRKQYHKHIGIFKARKQFPKWREKDGLHQVDTAMSQCSLKTTQNQPWNDYLRIYVQYQQRLWQHKFQKKYSKWKFRGYLLKRQYLDRYFSNLRRDESGKITDLPPIIAYGDGSFACTGKGEQSVPNKEIFRVCKRYYKTILINEFRTTAICNRCHQPLCKVITENNEAQHNHNHKTSVSEATTTTTTTIDTKAKETTQTFREVRGLKWCKSTKCFKFVNRDRNAARNILDKFHWLFANQEIPANFTRSGVPLLKKGKEATKYLDTSYHPLVKLIDGYSNPFVNAAGVPFATSQHTKYRGSVSAELLYFFQTFNMMSCVKQVNHELGSFA
jgi:hypothetical protein